MGGWNFIFLGLKTMWEKEKMLVDWHFLTPPPLQKKHNKSLKLCRCRNAFELNLYHLTHYHTIPTFNEEGFGKHSGKRRKCWIPAFSPFPTVFSTLSRREIIILTTSILSSANASNLNQVKILLFGKWSDKVEMLWRWVLSIISPFFFYI